MLVISNSNKCYYYYYGPYTVLYGAYYNVCSSFPVQISLNVIISNHGAYAVLNGAYYNVCSSFSIEINAVITNHAAYTRVVQPFGYGGPHWFRPWPGGPLCNIGRCQGDVWMWTSLSFVGLWELGNFRKLVNYLCQPAVSKSNIAKWCCKISMFLTNKSRYLSFNFLQKMTSFSAAPRNISEFEWKLYTL